MTMEIGAKKSSIEILQEAIEQLTDSRSRNTKPFHDIEIKTETQISPFANTSAAETQILTKLISQLESLKEDGIAKANEEESTSKKKEANEEIVLKELKNVKRQNTVTHWLLSGMIVLTVVWQLSEGLFILKLKDGVNHPFRSLWRLFRGTVRSPITNRGQDADKQSSSSSSSSIKDTLVESVSLPLKLTNEISQKDFELPDIQLPCLGSSKDI